MRNEQQTLIFLKSSARRGRAFKFFTIKSNFRLFRSILGAYIQFLSSSGN